MLFSDGTADVRSAAVTATAAFAAATIRAAPAANAPATVEPAGVPCTGDIGGPIVGGEQAQPSWIHKQNWFPPGQIVVQGALTLCADRSDKVRASALRAMGF